MNNHVECDEIDFYRLTPLRVGQFDVYEVE